MYSSFFVLEAYDIMILHEVDQIHRKLWILFQLWVLGDPNLIRINSQIFWEFGPFLVKSRNQMFSSIKMEECMEP